MKNDDLFFIHVLDRTLAYKVDQISVVKTEDTEKLQIIDGKDYVTLEHVPHMESMTIVYWFGVSEPNM